MLRFLVISLGMFFSLTAIPIQLYAAPYKAELATTGEGPWYVLPLDANMQFMSASRGLGDIRIKDSNGKVQPYAFYVAKDHANIQRSALIQAELYPLYQNGSGNNGGSNLSVLKRGDDISISVNHDPGNRHGGSKSRLQGYVFDLKKTVSGIVRFSLDWKPEKDGFYPYRLEISDDMVNWRLIANDQLYRLSNDKNVLDQKWISLNETKGRFLRLFWQNDGNAPIVSKATIDHLIMPQDEAIQSITCVEALRQKGDGYNGKEVYEVSLGVPHLIQTLKVRMPDGYFLAPFKLYGKYGASYNDWTLLREGRFYQIKGKNGDQERLDSVELPASEISALRIEIDPRGGGLDIQKLPLELSLKTQNLIFLARGTAPYTMEIGFPDQTPAALSFEDLVPDADNSGLSDQRIGMAHIAGPLIPIEMAGAPVEEPASENWKRYILWGVLVIGVAFLVLIAFQLMRQSDKNKGV